MLTFKALGLWTLKWLVRTGSLALCLLGEFCIIFHDLSVPLALLFVSHPSLLWWSHNIVEYWFFPSLVHIHCFYWLAASHDALAHLTFCGVWMIGVDSFAFLCWDFYFFIFKLRFEKLKYCSLFFLCMYFLNYFFYRGSWSQSHRVKQTRVTAICLPPPPPFFFHLPFYSSSLNQQVKCLSSLYHRHNFLFFLHQNHFLKIFNVIGCLIFNTRIIFLVIQ